jgi:hypothetical protein
MDEFTAPDRQATIKANQIINLLRPSLKRVRHNHNLYYSTAWGYKTEEGLVNSIKVVLRSEDQASLLNG